MVEHTLKVDLLPRTHRMIAGGYRRARERHGRLKSAAFALLGCGLTFVEHGRYIHCTIKVTDAGTRDTHSKAPRPVPEHRWSGDQGRTD